MFHILTVQPIILCMPLGIVAILMDTVTLAQS